eukprot:scaffold11923_cov100-Cylindrotheca_fusiformis.AAC.2
MIERSIESANATTEFFSGKTLTIERRRDFFSLIPFQEAFVTSSWHILQFIDIDTTITMDLGPLCNNSEPSDGYFGWA